MIFDPHTQTQRQGTLAIRLWQAEYKNNIASHHTTTTVVLFFNCRKWYTLKYFVVISRVVGYDSSLKAAYTLSICLLKNSKITHLLLYRFQRIGGWLIFLYMTDVLLYESCTQNITLGAHIVTFFPHVFFSNKFMSYFFVSICTHLQFIISSTANSAVWSEVANFRYRCQPHTLAISSSPFFAEQLYRPPSLSQINGSNDLSIYRELLCNSFKFKTTKGPLLLFTRLYSIQFVIKLKYYYTVIMYTHQNLRQENF